MKDGVVGCSHRRGARQVATQQLGLAEVAAGPELVDVPAAARHFGVHRCDDVERLARFAFLEDVAPGAKTTRSTSRPDPRSSIAAAGAGVQPGAASRCRRRAWDAPVERA
jgi:hypothetical protein